jgi:hypothetical protein
MLKVLLGECDGTKQGAMEPWLERERQEAKDLGIHLQCKLETEARTGGRRCHFISCVELSDLCLELPLTYQHMHTPSLCTQFSHPLRLHSSAI